MKLLFCEACGDIVAPYPRNYIRRPCSCTRHEVWWTDADRGELRVLDTRAQPPAEGSWWPKVPQAWVLGLLNDFLLRPGRWTEPAITDLVAQAPPAFRALGSVIVRVRPGESPDTNWATAFEVRQAHRAPTNQTRAQRRIQVAHPQ